ncbi:hypothetical protein MKW94_000019 [Papaver nudicaule]|uniref:DUF4216 domain-containing protein n=1 Tax=Papaver nudicaule TaxID=74823 RepID=A0AA41VFZ6_PAPNU|nr:hypothetical protein [Papaver nudicaule]
MRRMTQNSGVRVKGGEDEDDGENDYYGIVSEIIEARYLNQLRILLFKCNWRPVTNQRGSKRDSYGFTCVDLKRRCYTNEPFALAYQAHQVFYVKDIKNRQFEVVIKAQPRCSFNIPEDESTVPENSSSDDAYQEWYSGYSIEDLRQVPPRDDNENSVWGRNDVQPETISHDEVIASLQSQDEEESDGETIYTTDEDDENEFDNGIGF